MSGVSDTSRVVDGTRAERSARSLGQRLGTRSSATVALRGCFLASPNVAKQASANESSDVPSLEEAFQVFGSRQRLALARIRGRAPEACVRSFPCSDPALPVSAETESPRDRNRARGRRPPDAPAPRRGLLPRPSASGAGPRAPRSRGARTALAVATTRAEPRSAAGLPVFRSGRLRPSP